MGSACTTGSPTAYDAIDKPQSSAGHSSAGKRPRTSHLFPSSSEESEDSSSNMDDGPSLQAPCPEEVVVIPPKTPTPQPPPRPTPVQPKIASLAELPSDFVGMMCGRLDSPAYIEDKIIYIYHCSNFSDSQKERSALQLCVYPKLREFCAKFGCEVHVVDFLWGLRDEFLQGHVIRKHTIQFLERLCARDEHVISTVFLNEKYGNYWCPLQIDVDTVSAILKKVTEDDKHFFLSWYQLDENAVPPVYELQPIEWKVSRYQSVVKEVYKEGCREWEKELIRLRNVLAQAANPDFHRRYCLSATENEMMSTVLSDKIHRNNIIWLKRTFTKLNMESGNHVLSHYLDLHRDRLDENAQTKLKNLSNRIGDRIDPKHKVDVSLEWDEKVMSSPNLEPTRYLDEFCNIYEKTLEDVVKGVIAKKQEHDKTKIKLAHRGVSKTLQTDLMHNTLRCQNLTKSPIGQDDLVNQLEKYIAKGHITEADVKADTIHPLCLHGPLGSGKSTLAATLAKNSCSIEQWTTSLCVLRFIGASIECETLNQLLISVGEQIALLSGLQPKKEVHEKPLRDVLHNLLPKVPHENPLLIVMDGLDLLTPDHGYGDLQWMPTKLPAHVRMVVTMTSDSPVHQALMGHVGSDCIMLQIPYLSEEDFQLILDKELLDAGRKLTETQMDRLSTCLEGDLVPMAVKLTSKFATKWSSFTKMDEIFVSPSVNQMAKACLVNLEKNYGSKLVEKSMQYLAVCRYGLSDPEMMDLLSTQDAVMADIYRLHTPYLHRIPLFAWTAVKSELEEFLQERTHCGILVTSFKSALFRDLVTERYGRELATAREELLEYFDAKGGHSVKSSKISTKNSGSSNGLGRKVGLKSQPLKWEEAYNGRKLGEVPQLLTSHEKGLLRLLNECLFNWEWLFARLQSANPWQFALDLDLCHRHLVSGENEVNMKEIQFLEEWLKDLGWILCMDPSQFGSQLYMKIRSGKLAIDDNLPMCKNLYESALQTLPLLLVPDDPSIFKALSTTSEPQHVISKFFCVKGDENHVISVATHKGELKIWNIHSQEVVRTLYNLQEPKDLKMLDFCQVVLLCNRELSLYNLDKGTKLITLKGVLNIRMPFFGIHDKDHTIAMARNRMYVNMMSNVTGEMVTTFKVGEDRFLNSLLVSEQGNVCVCGDAVQKPFPLLVWDLHARKLIYDLRITGHEFLTKMAAITTGGEYVAVVCREIEDPDPNFIMVYDLQTGLVFRKFKHDFSAHSVAICSKTSLVVSGHEDGSVVVWDLIGGSCRYQMKGHSRGPDVIRISDSGTHAVSYDSSGLDSTLWYWHLVDGLTIGCFCNEYGVSCAEISPDGMTIIIGLPGCEDIVTLHSPGHVPPENIGVFGDASRKGECFDMSQICVPST